MELKVRELARDLALAGTKIVVLQSEKCDVAIFANYQKGSCEEEELKKVLSVKLDVFSITVLKEGNSGN